VAKSNDESGTMNDELRVPRSAFFIHTCFQRRPVNSDVRPPREGGMKTELQRLEEQLERALEGEAWHGPSLLEVLEGVSAHQAAAHPIAGAHSIWELVLHLCSDSVIPPNRLKANQ